MPQHFAAQPPFVPKAETMLVVQLPGERVRAKVVQVADEDSAIVVLEVAPMLFGKTHRYRKDDFVPVRRKHTGMEEIWAAVDEQQLALAQAVQRLDETAPPPEPEPAPEPTAPPVVAEPPKETQPDAPCARKQPKRGEPKHPRDGRKRPSATPSRGRRAVERTPAPARRGRARGG